MGMPILQFETSTPSLVRNGDVVVGKYNDYGHKINNSKIIGDAADLNKMASAIARHSSMAAQAAYAPTTNGKSQVVAKEPKPAKGKKGKKVAEPVSFLPSSLVEINPPELVKKTETSFNVVIHNKFGKIKLNVIGILEEEKALCLIFKNENDIIFAPEQGDIFDLILPTNRTIKVASPETIFTWTDHETKLMLLVKQN